MSRNPPCPPGNSVANSDSKFAATSANADANTVTISPSTALITRESSRRRRLHVLELRLEERVALLERLELLERERVDRAHEPQLALELADAGVRCDALGQRRALRGDRGVGLAVEVAAQGLDRGLEAQLDLGLVELGAP